MTNIAYQNGNYIVFSDDAQRKLHVRFVPSESATGRGWLVEEFGYLDGYREECIRQATNYVDIRVMLREVFDFGSQPVSDRSRASSDRLANLFGKLGSFRKSALASAIHDLSGAAVLRRASS